MSSGAMTSDELRGGRRALTVGLLAGIVCVAFESVAVATAMPSAVRWRMLASISATAKARWRSPAASGVEGRAGGAGNENSSIRPPSGSARSSFHDCRAAR